MILEFAIPHSPEFITFCWFHVMPLFQFLGATGTLVGHPFDTVKVCATKVNFVFFIVLMTNILKALKAL